MKAKLVGCLFVTLLLGVTCYALAQPPQCPQPGMLFERLDSDQDGMISRAEFEQSALQRQAYRRGAPNKNNPQERLKKADANEDGVVSKAEFEEAFPKAPEKRFMQLDTNKDGVLTKADRPRAPQGMQGGKGRDGRQGPSAKQGKGKGGRSTQQAAKGPGKAGRSGKNARGGFMPSRPCSPEGFFKACDANQDGVITLEEFKKAPCGKAPAPRARFERVRSADQDGDKRLSFEEAQDAFPGLGQEKFDRRDKNNDGFWDWQDRGPVE